MRIYGDKKSGNCHKVKYVADCLRLTYEWVEVDITRGETRTPAYLANNPQGQVPAIALADGRWLAQSNAIIRFLATGTPLLPTDPFEQAKVDEWLFWEQYSHEPYVAVCRFAMVYQGKPASEREPWRVERGDRALDLLQSILVEHEWLANDRFSIADVSLLAYTRLAHEGGFDLTSRPDVERWIERCETRLALDPSPVVGH